MTEGISWTLHPGAEGLVKVLQRRLLGDNRAAREFGEKLSRQTSTRMMDWIDHIRIPAGWIDIDDLLKTGFERDPDIEIDDATCYRAPGSMLPPIILGEDKIARLLIKVEDLDTFISANGARKEPRGKKHSALRYIVLSRENNVHFGGIERRGYRGFIEKEEDDTDAYLKTRDALGRRERTGFDENMALEELLSRLREYKKDLHVSRVADVFFRTERRYWESRDPDALRQLRRQNTLGLGWGNRDHHTYRNSRENLKTVVSILEEIGMVPRERFYAGEQAGWGAQVLEHEDLDTVVFADVDMEPVEKDGDFAHAGLKGRDELGTVGLWVALHGESMLEAGLHHLAARVDFMTYNERARSEGNAPMDPFSSFPHLKQCFTKGVNWKIDPKRGRSLLDGNRITQEQFSIFTTSGARGSHLELIERNQGFKGFNQSAVSDIIRRTDPRR